MARTFLALACLADVIVGLIGAAGLLGLEMEGRLLAVGVSVVGVVAWRRYNEETAR